MCSEKRHNKCFPAHFPRKIDLSVTHTIINQYTTVSIIELLALYLL